MPDGSLIAEHVQVAKSLGKDFEEHNVFSIRRSIFLPEEARGGIPLCKRAKSQGDRTPRIHPL
jgi:hypothetical protein